jgi:Domain of unknown function (DUF4386)
MTLNLEAPASEATARTSTRTRLLLVLVAIAIGGIGNVIATLNAPPSGDSTLDWAAGHQSAWASGLFGNALAGLGLVALLAAVCALARRRGARWATVSLAIGSLGTFLFVVSSGVTTVYLPIAKQTVLTPAQTTALADYLAQHDMSQGAVAFPAFVLLLITQITLTVALIRSRAVPLWVPIVFLAGGAMETVFAGSGALTAVLTVPQIIAEIVIGWYAWQKASA